MNRRTELWKLLKARKIKHDIRWHTSTVITLQNLLNNPINEPIYKEVPLQEDIIFDSQNIANVERQHQGNPKIKIYRHVLPESFKGLITKDNVADIITNIRNNLNHVYNNIKSKATYFSAATISITNKQINNFSYTASMETLLEQIQERLLLYAENYDSQGSDPLRLTAVDFIYMLNAADIIRATKNAVTTGNNIWYVIDSTTIDNCVYVAIKTCMYWRTNFNVVTDKTYRIKLGTKLKFNLKHYDIGDIEYETLEYVAQAMGINLNIYNDSFELLSNFNYDITDSEPVNIMVSNNHAKAMISKIEISKVHKDFTFPVIVYNDKNYQELECFKYTAEKSINSKIATYDFETYLTDKTKGSKIGSDKQFTVYASGISYYQDDKIIEHYVFDDNDNLNKLFNYIFENITIFDGYTFYAHNGGKFDIILLLRDVFQHRKDIIIKSRGLIELNSSIVGLSITYNPKVGKSGTIHFKDSYRMFQSSLAKVTRDLNVANIKGEIAHRLINKNTFKSKESEIMAYLKNDVIGLLQALEIFNRNIFNKFQISLPSCYTSASLAKKIYFTHNRFSWHLNKLYSPSKETDAYIRKSYKGGRCEAFYIGAVKNVYYYDFTSLYPAMGCSQLPCGKSQNINLSGVSMEKFIARLGDCYYENVQKVGFVRTLVRGSKKDLNNKKPLHGTTVDNKLLFSYFDNWQELTLYTEEIKAGLKFGYQYRPIDAVLYKRDVVMKTFFKECYTNKLNARENDQKALEVMWKIIINSGYGYWGYNPLGKDSLKLYKDGGWKRELSRGTLKSFRSTDNGYVFATVSNEDRPKNTSVAIASSITSLSRILMHQLMVDIEAAGGIIYYCDTDSVFTNLKFSDHPTLMLKYRADGTGAALGSLKNEIGLLNGQDISFDKLTIAGCKAYSMVYQGLPYSTKLKGYKKKDAQGNVVTEQEQSENIDTILNGGIVEQYQMQILCNRQDYVGSGFDLRYTENEHNPKKIKYSYTKGVVESTGFVTPFSLV